MTSVLALLIVEEDKRMKLEEIDHLLSRAEQCEDEHFLMLIVNELECQARELGTPELLYACAYVWYVHPRRLSDDSISSRVDDLLRRVLEMLPEDYCSLLYLGHNTYDHENYEEAKVYFEKARQVAPKSYVGLKAYEMVVCCELMMGGLRSEFLASLATFVTEASQPSYTSEDIWPRELAMALQRTSLAREPDAQRFEEASQLADRLDRVGALNGWIGSLVRRLESGSKWVTN